VVTLEVLERAGLVSFLVRVQLRANRDEIAGEWEGALRIRLAAPPVEGRANEALVRLLAGRLNVPLAAVRIAVGERSRNKRIEIKGVNAAQVQALVAPPVVAGRKHHEDDAAD
jgi:uncharacterized protein (TIGR00251 family)